MAAREYFSRLQGFRPNAKLLLARSLISPLGYGIWGVVFNIYLLTIEVDGKRLFTVDFIYAMVAVDWLVHGLAAFPGGLFSDRFGRRITFLLASVLAVGLNIGKLFSLDPTVLLVLSGLTGFGGAFHAVTSGPFLIENCTKEDRAHLFSAQTMCGLASSTCGALLGGVLPAILAGGGLIGTAEARLALMISIPFFLVGLAPIYLIKERWVEPESYGRHAWYVAWTKNITSVRTISKLCSVSALGALGVGAVVPVFSVFFLDRFGVYEEGVGYIFAIGSLAAAGGMTAAPLLVARLGRARTIAFTKLLAVPFLVVIPLAPVAALAALPFVVRAVFNDLAGPIFSLFTMELVNPEERGATAGLIHSTSEFPMGLAAFAMSWIMARGGDWNVAFGVAAAFTFLAYVLFLRLFGRIERTPEPVVATGAAT